MAKRAASAAPQSIVDVTSPGKTPPSENSRSVIIPQRSRITDPMMVSDAGATPVQDIVPSSQKPALEPLSAPALPQAKKADTPKPIKTVAPLASELVAKHKKAAKKAATVKPAAPAPTAEQPQPTVTKPAEATPEPVKPVATKDVAEATSAKPDKPELPDTVTANAQPADPLLDEVEAQEKHDAAIQKLIDSKQFELPINSVEKRRTKRVVIGGTLASIALLLVWLNIALDAGLITIPGVKAVTHFFSS